MHFIAQTYSNRFNILNAFAEYFRSYKHSNFDNDLDILTSYNAHFIWLLDFQLTISNIYLELIIQNIFF